MAAKKYDADVHPIAVYEYARSGMNNAGIAAALGITPGTFARWRTTPAVHTAIARAREITEAPKTLREYIAGHLPSHLLPLWTDLIAAQGSTDPQRLIDDLLSPYDTAVRQQLFFHAYASSSFNFSTAARMVGISKHTIDTWRRDPMFFELMEEVHFQKQNYFEHALISCVARGDTTAILFCARTQLRDRGYGDTAPGPTAAEQDDTAVMAEALDALPMEQRRALLAAHMTLEGRVNARAATQGR